MIGEGACSVCGTKIRRGLLMCRSDWRRVPRDLQADVYEALADFEANTITLGELREVQRSAIRAAAR